MKVLFLTLARITNIKVREIYTDLMRKFRDEGHELFIVTPTERRFREKTKLNIIDHVNILQVKTLNIQKANIIEKGIGTLLIEYQFLNAINKHLNHKKFDLILYSTPPITLTKVISNIKKKNGASTYLLLKDIFPQNAVDLGMIKKNSYLHKYFRKKEQKWLRTGTILTHPGCISAITDNFFSITFWSRLRKI